MSRYLIVNADDFGASTGVNRGIVEAHRHGVVTSTSMTVTGRSAVEAAAMSRDNPDLAVGLHWDVWGEDEREFDTTDVPTVKEEFTRQLDEFVRLMGRPPSHVDSHRHAHLEHGLLPVFAELVEPLGVPLRGDGKVKFVGGFYGQWEWKVTDLSHISINALVSILRSEIDEGWTELSCHPAYVTDDYLHSVYLYEREVELATLCHPRIRTAIRELGLELVSYAEWPLDSTTAASPGRHGARDSARDDVR